MSEQALPIAIEGRERANAAHKRLDGINGSIDRFSRKQEDLAEKVDDQYLILDGKLNSILITLATQEGAEGMRARFLDSRKWMVVLVAGLLSSSLAVLIFTLLTRHPNG